MRYIFLGFAAAVIGVVLFRRAVRQLGSTESTAVELAPLLCPDCGYEVEGEVCYECGWAAFYPPKY